MDTRKRRKEGLTTLSPLYESLQSPPKRARVHAQRKFAQGSQPNSPALTPVKEVRDLRDRLECRTRLSCQVNSVSSQPIPVPHVIEPPTRPKTEDFLTFLCFRKTPMLPPELEFFETPQLLETSSAPDDLRPESPPVRDEKLIKPNVRKKEEFNFEKKVFCKEPLKKSFEDAEIDSQNLSPPSARVTRSSASLTPAPSFLSSPSSDASSLQQTPKKKLTRKQLLLKKAALFKSKTLRAHRRSIQLRLRSTGDTECENSLALLDSPKPFKSSLKLGNTNKNIKVAKILSLKKREQVSRILKRLGSSELPTADIEGRVTRSKVDPPDVSLQNDRDSSGLTNDEINSSSDFNEAPKSSSIQEAYLLNAGCKKDLLDNEIGTLMSSDNDSVVNTKTTVEKKLLPSMKLRNIKRKSCLEVKRVTRRLLNIKKESSTVPSQHFINEANDYCLDDVKSTCQFRCTRSASDSGIVPEKEISSSKVLRKVSDRSKSCDEKVSETCRKRTKFKTIKEESLSEEPGPIVRSRPSRKTKQVAEIYLELISKKLAKESQQGKDFQNDEELMDDDNISISSIKELETLSKEESKDIQKCVQEFAEKHDKGMKDQRVANESKEKLIKSKSEKTDAVKADKTSHSDPSHICDVRKVLKTNVKLSSPKSNSGISNKKSLNVKKRGSLSPCEEIILSQDIVNEKLVAVNNTKSSSSHRSPRSPKLTQSSDITQHNLRPIRTAQVLPGNSSHTLMQSRLSLSPSLSISNSSKESSKQTLEQTISPSSIPPTKVPKKRTLSDIANQNHKEKASRRLSLDISCSLFSSNSENEATVSILDSKRNSKTNIHDNEEEDVKKENINEPVAHISKSSCGSPINLPILSKELCKPTLANHPNKITKCEKNSLPKNELISVITGEGDPAFTPKKLIDKVKCMVLSPRSKRTLSLDTLEKDKRAANSKNTRLKKFSSLDNVGSSSKSDLTTVMRPKQLQLDLTLNQFPSFISKEKEVLPDYSANIPTTSKKSSYCRRRNSVHDEAKLNEVLESIAKDFKKDMDDSHYDKLEKDLNSGNKSPEKANRSILENVKLNKPKCTIAFQDKKETLAEFSSDIKSSIGQGSSISDNITISSSSSELLSTTNISTGNSLSSASIPALKTNPRISPLPHFKCGSSSHKLTTGACSRTSTVRNMDVSKSKSPKPILKTCSGASPVTSLEASSRAFSVTMGTASTESTATFTEANSRASPMLTSEVSSRSSPLPISEVSLRASPLPISEVCSQASPLPISEVCSRASPLPISEVCLQASPLPISEVCSRASPLPISEVCLRASPLPISEVCSQASPLPISEVSSRASPLPPSASPSTSGRKICGKKLCEVVRNLQERKQAESPLNYDETETPTFVQDLKDLEAEKQKQVSEEQNGDQNLDIILAPAPSIASTSFTDISEEISTVNITSPSVHSCTSETDAQIFKAKSDYCESSDLIESLKNENADRIHLSKKVDAERAEQMTTPLSSVFTPLSSIHANLAPLLTVANAAALSNTNINQTSFMSVLPVTSEPILSMPVSNLNIAVPTVTINPAPLANLRLPTSIGINVAANQLPATLVSSRISHLGHGITLNSAAISSPTVMPEFKSIKCEHIQKTGTKQILIAPKPTKNSKRISNHMAGSTSGLKHLPKPVQIAPKLPISQGSPQVGHMHATAPIISGSPMGHMIQGVTVPHSVQTLSQTLQAVQALPQGVQPLQAMAPNFSSIAGMTSAVPAVITQTVALNANHLVTPSPTKLITQPVPIFVTSSMPNVMASQFDFAMQNHLHGNVGTVARVVTQNMIGKLPINHKPHGSNVPVNSVHQPMVTLSSGSGCSNLISSIVPFHQSLQQGHPTQFVAVNMMPIGSSHLPISGTGHISSAVGPLICSQAVGVATSSGVQVPCSVASLSGPLNIIPSGPLLPLHDVSIGNSGLVHPISCTPTIASTSQVIVSSANAQNCTHVGLVLSSAIQNHLQENTTTLGSQSMVLGLSDDSSLKTELKLDELETSRPDSDNEYFNSDNNDADESNMDISLETTEDNEDASQENDKISLSNCNKYDKFNEMPHCADIGRSEATCNLLSSSTSMVSNKVITDTLQTLEACPAVNSPVLSASMLFSSQNVESGNQCSSSEDLKRKDQFKNVSEGVDSFYHSPHVANVINKFAYAATTVVIPKPAEQGMTSPRAITNVSQSSPPYVLSTSTSNEYSNKSPLILRQPKSINYNSTKIVETAETNNQEADIISDSSLQEELPCDSVDETHQTSNNDKDISNEPISKILSKFVSSSVTVTPMPISSKVAMTVQSKVSLSPAPTNVQSNWSPRSFYSSNIIKASKVGKSSEVVKSKMQKVDIVKTSLTFDEVKISSGLESSSGGRLKESFENEPAKESTSIKSTKENIKVSKAKYFNKSQGKSSKESRINGKDALLLKSLTSNKGELEARKEPIIKRRTLFKTKHCENQKTSDAFSPLNESSVYAFEPDLDAPLEVTTPFYHRIKNIQPTPPTVKKISTSKPDKIKTQASSSLKLVSVEDKDNIKKEKVMKKNIQPLVQGTNSTLNLDQDKNYSFSAKQSEKVAKNNVVKKNSQTLNKKGTFTESIKEVSISISVAAAKSSAGISTVDVSPINSVYKHPTPIKSNDKSTVPISKTCQKSLFVDDNKSLSSSTNSNNAVNTLILKTREKLVSSVTSETTKSIPVPHFKEISTESISSREESKHQFPKNDNTPKNISIVKDRIGTDNVQTNSLAANTKENSQIENYSTKILSLTSNAKEQPGPTGSNVTDKLSVITTSKNNPKFERLKKGSRPFPSKANKFTGKDFKCNSNTLPFAIACEKVPLKYIPKCKQPPVTSLQDKAISQISKIDANPSPVFTKDLSKKIVQKSFETKNKAKELKTKTSIQMVTKVAISEAYNIVGSEEKRKDDAPSQASNSTSIAIQCDLDDSQSDMSQDEIKGNESGTQTEKPSKFPLPPSASPFYYLPLAMATLGEKLPAQLVQQMLAKTQGLVGAAEAGLILQQAAQLAQQYHKNSEEDGSSALTPCSAVKPISPKSGSIALQKALRANLASMAQAEISVAQNTGSQLACQPNSQTSGSLSTQVSSLSKQINSGCSKGLLKIVIPETESTLNSGSNCKVSKNVKSNCNKDLSVNLAEETSHIKEEEDSMYKNSALSKMLVGFSGKQPLQNKGIKEVNACKENENLILVQEKPESSTKHSSTKPDIREPITLAPKVKRAKIEDILVKRRSGRSTTLASTKATEFDLHEAEEIRRNRRAKRAAAVLAREEGWSSSSEPPLSPTLSPDVLRGWPPPRLTSPTPSQSSEGTTASSTPSQRSRVSAPHSRRHSPAGSIDSRRPGRYSNSSNAPVFPSDPVIDPEPLHISDNPKLARAPSFFPSEEEFTEPLDFIEKIRPEAEQFGLCRIVPPSNFRPECRVNDDMRFTAYRQYTHRMMKRWGPSDRTLCAIKKCLAKQNIELTSNPLIGGLELDLVYLYNVVEDHGGLMHVIEKELWSKVSDVLRIPKSAQDRVTKLDSIYCKYLLPYAMLSSDERKQLLSEVDAVHLRSQCDELSKKSGSVHSSDNEDDDEEEPLDCIVKGKSTALSAFYRIARNIAHQWQPDPDGLELDERYWDIVKNGNSHVCVHAASIDTAEHCYGFPSQKNSSSAKHPWNLKNLVQNPNSVLRSMGNVIGVTSPTLHVGMMFSTVCWYRDPHSLPWVEYLHTGASKMWYGVASSSEDQFRSAMKKLVPDYIKDSPVWLPSDTAMVPPDDLVKEDVKVCRVIQEPGQFVVVFPGAFTSSVCSGYLISESAFFARPQYFDRAVSSFKTLFECFEPSMFSLDRLALSVASDTKATLEALIRAKPVVEDIIEREKRERNELVDLGLILTERFSNPALYRKKKNRYEDEEEITCEICRQHLYISFIFHENEEISYCLIHAINYISLNADQVQYCKLLYTFSLPELTSALKQLDERILTKNLKKGSSLAGKRGRLPDNDSFSSTSSSNL